MIKIGRHRLTLVGLLLLVVVLVVVAIGIQFVFTKFYKPSRDVVTSQVDTQPTITSSETLKNRDSRQLPVEPALAKDAVTVGIVQLAPSGLYKYIFDSDGTNHHLIEKELQTELINEGFPPTVEELNSKLTKYIGQMMNRKGKSVTDNRYVQFVTTSGAMKNEKIAKSVEQLEKNKYTVTRTTVEEEGRYALDATLTKAQRDDSFVIDLTPSFTRLSWYDNGKPKTILLPGSKYYQKITVDGVDKPPLTDEEVRAETLSKLRELPQKNRQNGVIIWAAADGSDGSKGLKKDNSRYAFLEDTYSTDDKLLTSGLNILYTVQGELKASMYFDWETSYVIGFGQTFVRK